MKEEQIMVCFSPFCKRKCGNLKNVNKTESLFSRFCSVIQKHVLVCEKNDTKLPNCHSWSLNK